MVKSPDMLDRGLVHALFLDGRAPFARIAEALEVSDQTVARRYRRLRAEAGLRVVGIPNYTEVGIDRWWTRIQCAPGSARAIAEALAKRPETAWVQIVSGGTEILCSSRVPSSDDHDPHLEERLPRTSRITGFSSHALLHTFAGGMLGCCPVDWLTPAQAAFLTPAPRPAAERPEALGELDERLFTELGLDGRTSTADLAKAAGWSESSVRRRLDQLVDSGLLYFDVEAHWGTLGFRTAAWLWMSLAPADLAATGAFLAGQREVVFAAATTGPSNLCACVIGEAPADLYEFVTHRLAQVPVRSIEIMPVIRTVKQSGGVLPGR